ncbi:MAG: ABC transporter permease [Candidatus Thorarchaeota archaeon]
MQFDLIAVITDYFESLPLEVQDAVSSYIMAMVLLVMLLLVTKWQGIGVGSRLIVGTIRGTVQIVLMALILIEIFALEDLVIMFLVLTFMAFFAAHTTSANLKHIPGVFKCALPGILIGGLSVMAMSVALGVVEQTGEFIIPMGGMVLGNSMMIASLVVDRMYSDAQKQTSLIETALALGASAQQAMDMTIKESIEVGLLPNLNRYVALGIVAIPGLMSGMIIGGAEPIAAAFFQVIVFIMIFLSATITGLIISRLFVRQMFNERVQLIITPQEA